ncbi:monooxygenase [Colletotrichum orchidophilum]|uniref:Monooxygenase n=1 Tax=Colletotrichum orchidophilum TaxID=1209926 RepID=A0A1G4B155_9PEZI|nr:monooxygenase [Colletotrichum orchidophilum]OHE95055.1 monooxygenase [Colletotrichum orchidophilum]
MEKFQGAMFHTTQWDHKVDFKGKKIAFIGNGEQRTRGDTRRCKACGIREAKECTGAQAYLGTYVRDTPNLAYLFDPNTFPANDSDLFTCKTQGDYAVKSLFRPLMNPRASMIEMKQSAEDCETNAVANKVFSGTCLNW